MRRRWGCLRTTVFVWMALVCAACGRPLDLSGTESSPLPPSLPFASPVAQQEAVTPLAAQEEAPTASPLPSATAAPPTATIGPPTATPIATVVPADANLSNAERWLAQQAAREVFEPRRTYAATSPAALYWYDPTTGQSLEIGLLLGEFPTLASFTFVPTGAPALLVPYTINQDYGLTAISPAIVERMRAAGATETVEAYVVIGAGIEAR